MNLKKLIPENGPPISEVKKYIEKYKNDLIVIKYGGNVLIDRNIFDNFITDISILNKLDLSVIIVHGGGPRIKKELDIYIAKKNLSLNFFLESINCNFICISDNEQTFINMNKKEDFEKVKRIFELSTTK